MRSLIICFAFIVASACSSIFAADYSAAPGPFAFGTIEQVWHDDARNRDVPVRIYYPKSNDEKSPVTYPVIIFSHGLGGSREGYAYLGEHWASCGYVSVHVQHRGSDQELLRHLRPLKYLREAAANPVNAVNRPLDVSFAIDRLTALNHDENFPLHGKLDLARLGMAGHSFGAFTTMAISGAHLLVLGTEKSYADPRVKAAIAMSTPTTQDNDEAFDDIRIPIFHLTGTKDGSSSRKRDDDSDPVIGNTTATERLRPFRHTHHAPAYLLVFEGGDHLVFSGRRAEARPGDGEFQARILSSSTAFWDAWLKEEKPAREWLETGGFTEALGKFGTFEVNAPQ